MEWANVASHFSARWQGTHLMALVLCSIVIVDVVRRFNRVVMEKRGNPLPPGPTPLPLLGSALSVDSREPWLTYNEWRAKYGDVVYARLLDSDVILLNSYSDAVELLEKRSKIYSDRPFIATIEPYGHGGDFAFARYGSHWRLCRRIVHQTFRAEAVLAFRPIQLHRARQLVISIIDNPKEYYFHYLTFSAAVGMSAIYGYEPQPRGDPMVKLVDDFCDASVPSLIPEMAILLIVFPFLLSVPKWIPVLSRVRRQASKAHALGIRVVETPYQWVRNRMEAKEGFAASTMVFNHIQCMENLDGSRRAEYETALKQAAFTSFLASEETTAATLMSFTLAMIKNPHIWRRAQAEIDRVIGTDRLPAYEDRPSLPYVGAILRETLRWKPVSPMGVPHAVTCDDVYKNYFIPRGAAVFANIWAMTRDKSRYPNPEVFDPERFLDAKGKLNEDNPAEFVFGFGRRGCPGRYTADASVWIGIVTTLATLNFDAVKDKSGSDIEFEAKFTTGLTHQPVPFPCNLSPRAHVTKEVLQRALGK